jgi:hypothetical protein
MVVVCRGDREGNRSGGAETSLEYLVQEHSGGGLIVTDGIHVFRHYVSARSRRSRVQRVCADLRVFGVQPGAFLCSDVVPLREAGVHGVEHEVRRFLVPSAWAHHFGA